MNTPKITLEMRKPIGKGGINTGATGTILGDIGVKATG